MIKLNTRCFLETFFFLFDFKTLKLDSIIVPWFLKKQFRIVGVLLKMLEIY